MPSDNFQGILPPLTVQQRKLEAELRTYVQNLAGTIAERNLSRLKQLVAAADYIRATLGGLGYRVRTHLYQVSGNPCENLDVEIIGKDRSDQIVVVGLTMTQCRAVLGQTTMPPESRQYWRWLGPSPR